MAPTRRSFLDRSSLGLRGDVIGPIHLVRDTVRGQELRTRPVNHVVVVGVRSARVCSGTWGLAQPARNETDGEAEGGTGREDPVDVRLVQRATRRSTMAGAVCGWGGRAREAVLPAVELAGRGRCCTPGRRRPARPTEPRPRSGADDVGRNRRGQPGRAGPGQHPDRDAGPPPGRVSSPCRTRWCRPRPPHRAST